MKCANCEKPLENTDTKLTVGETRNDGVVDGKLQMSRHPYAAICSTCQENVLTMKLVFKREKPTDDFKFEQYLPVESFKG